MYISNQDKASVLIEALPYIQRFAGKTIVVKYGGNAMINDELKNSVMEDLTLLKYIGLNPILVHGGGPDISEALKTFNIESEFYEIKVFKHNRRLFAMGRSYEFDTQTL